MTRTLTAAVAAMLVIAAVGPAVGASTSTPTDTPTPTVTDIATSHGLATEAAVTAFKRQGYAEGDVDRYRIRLAIGDDKEAVGAADAIASDFRNDYLKINYSEDYPRTIRFLLPRGYITPYRTEVESLTSNHTATLEPARSGDYLQVTVAVTGEATIVLPLNKDHAVSYGLIERVDQRLRRIVGISPLDRQHEWTYIEDDRIEHNATLALNYSADGVVVQYDATPNATDETWVNLPRTERVGSPVYRFSRNEEGPVYVVVRSRQSPAIRYRTKGVLGGRVHGWVNDAAQIPENIVRLVKKYIRI